MDSISSCRPRDRSITRGPFGVCSGHEPNDCRATPQRRAPVARTILAIAGGCWLLGATPATADEERWQEVVKGLHPYAAVAYTDDSNLLRLSDSVPGAKSDQFTTLEAGFDSSFDVSQQRFLIDGRVYRNLYDRFDQYDHTGGDARLLWQWAHGKLWEGDLGYTYSRKLRDFANQSIFDADGRPSILLPPKDLIDRHRIRASAKRWITTRWRAGGLVDWADISSSESPRLDKRLTGGGVVVDWVSESGNTVGFETLYRDAAFKNASVADYEDWYSGLNARWDLSSKTLLSARGGYQKREYDEFTAGNFDGFVGDLGATWRPTVKTSVVASISRDISNLQDEIANYAVIDAVGLEPSWSITEKTTLRGWARYERRDFRGTGEVVEDLADREDDVYSYGLWLDWRFLTNGTVSLGYRTEERESNRVLRDYDYNSVQAMVSIGL